jgi:hypothetical protein
MFFSPTYQRRQGDSDLILKRITWCTIIARLPSLDMSLRIVSGKTDVCFLFSFCPMLRTRSTTMPKLCHVKNFPNAHPCVERGNAD